MTTLYIFLMYVVVVNIGIHVPLVTFDRRRLKAYFENGVRHGRTTALEEMEKIREDRGVGYRESAMIAGGKCPSCKAHDDAEEEAVAALLGAEGDKADSRDFNSSEATDLYVHHVKEQGRQWIP